MAANAPNPTDAEIMHQLELDMQRNPHGDHNKPKRRSRDEVVADLKIDHAFKLMARLEARLRA